MFSDTYTPADNSWFHALTTGMNNMRSLPPVSGDIEAPHYNIIGNPELDYYIASDDSLAKGCVGQGYGLIDAHVGFDNIPTYTLTNPLI
jgi:hypothetical protein